MPTRVIRLSLLVFFLAVSLSCIMMMPQPDQNPPAEEPGPAPEEDEPPSRIDVRPDVLALAKPERFTLNFQDAYLVHNLQSGVLQITAQGNVLNYGEDWEVRRVKSFLYHLRLRTWQGFFWKVNTSRREAYRIRGGTFGAITEGASTDLPFTVDVVGGAGNNDPQRFTLRFPKAHMVYSPDNDVLQLITEGNVLSYCTDWKRCTVNANHYHFKQKEWDGFFWKVNTAGKKAWRVRNGNMCRQGGSEQALSIRVDVTR